MPRTLSRRDVLLSVPPTLAALSLAAPATDRLNLGEGMDGLTIKRGAEGIPRRLFHQGELLFHPAGSRNVRVQFTIRPRMTTRVRVTDGAIVVDADGC
jgi:hypothetical protein